MAELTVHQRFARSQDIWGAAAVTVLFVVVAATVTPSWPLYVFFAAFIAVSWWIALRRLWRTWIRVTGSDLEISEPPRKVERVPRSAIRSIEAHPGDRYFQLLADAGPIERFRGIWFADHLEAVGRALGVPVCRDDGPSCRRTDR